VSSNEKLVRQYVRETLIAERKGRSVAWRRGQETPAHVVSDAIGWFRELKDMLGHFWNAIKSLAMAGTALYKGAESVFKIGAEGVKSVVGGGRPDYDSIVTNQAAALRKMRDFTGTEKLPTLGQSLGLFSAPSGVRISETLYNNCLEKGSLLFLIESEEQMVDQAVQAASTEMSQGQMTLPETPDALGEIPPPAISPESAEQVAIEMGRAASIDVSNLMNLYHSAMNSSSLEGLVNIITPVLGGTAQGSEFTPERLLQRASEMTQEEITQEDVAAGSNELMTKLKSILPQAFMGILGGSIDKIMENIASEPSPVQEAVRAAIMPPYEAAISQLKT